MEIVKSESKRKQGRPTLYSEPMVRGSFRVPVDILDALKQVSGGNVTRAIMELVTSWKEERITHPTPYATIQYSATCPLYPDCEAPSPDCWSPSISTGVPPVTSTQR